MIVPDAKAAHFAKKEFLDARIYVSGPVARSLRNAADLLGYPNGDALANAMLLKSLDEVEGLAAMERDISNAIQRAKENRKEQP